MSFQNGLPIDEVLPGLLAQLAVETTVLLQAPTGSGKTTRVPPALLDANWRKGKRIIMLEPRRLAARSAAEYMARQLGERAGQTIGYRTRLDSKISPATQVEVVTEGILVRLIQSDPELADYAAVIFDEFHERSIHADLGLALVRDSQQALRADLRVLIMSATLESERLAAALDGCPLITAQGRSFPVEVEYRPSRPQRNPEAHAASVIVEALEKHEGSALVFLPGMAEIRRLEQRLEGRLPDDASLHVLHGQLGSGAQDSAVSAPPAGQRKIVLSSAVAESSLTIEDIRVVIDAGLQRRAHFDPNSGMTRLITRRVSKASAEQRRGRAGRTAPGICYRLMSSAEYDRLRPQTPPEILSADLAPAVLELANWGVSDPGELTWLDPPPEAAWQQSTDLLVRLGALGQRAQITAHGRAMLATGLHPRLAHMVLRGRELGLAQTAARLAGLLQERSIGRFDSVDISLRLQKLIHSRARSGPIGRALQTARQLATGAKDRLSTPNPSGRLLALAWPDRIGQARGQRGHFRLANGRGAFLDESDPLAGEDWLVACELDGQARQARIFLAAALNREELEEDHAGRMETIEKAGWDNERGTVMVRRQRRLDALVLDDADGGPADDDAIQAGLLAAVRHKGLQALPWTNGARQWQARVELLRSRWPDEWPAVDDDALRQALDEWLPPWLTGCRRWADVEKLDMQAVLNSLVSHDQQQRLGQLAPAQLELPDGRRRRLDYCNDTPPVLAVRVQALFGSRATPTIAGGKIPVTLHLLSPARRPLAITADLASFWQNAWSDVRKDMRGRYPKHSWPENPLKTPPEKR